jgi:tRNA(Ile)-lysidine synthase TilS/MesJ
MMIIIYIYILLCLGAALESFSKGSSSVFMRVTYVDEQIRIIRPANNIPSEDNVVFVYRRIITSWVFWWCCKDRLMDEKFYLNINIKF